MKYAVIQSLICWAFFHGKPTPALTLTVALHHTQYNVNAGIVNGYASIKYSFHFENAILMTQPL